MSFPSVRAAWTCSGRAESQPSRAPGLLLPGCWGLASDSPQGRPLPLSLGSAVASGLGRSLQLGWHLILYGIWNWVLKRKQGFSAIFLLAVSRPEEGCIWGWVTEPREFGEHSDLPCLSERKQAMKHYVLYLLIYFYKNTETSFITA